MNRRVTAFVANHILRPPLIVIGFVFRSLYWVSYGWWGEKRYLAKAQQKFEAEIRQQFSDLFLEHKAEIVPNDNLGDLALLKWPIVTVVAENLVFRFVMWRDTRQVFVASGRLPNEWEELSEILNAVDSSIDRHSIVSFKEADQLIERQFESLKEAFSPERYPRIREQLDREHRYEMSVTRQVQDEINRNLYPENKRC